MENPKATAIPQGLSPTLRPWAALHDELQTSPSWEGRYKILLATAELLQDFPETLKTDAHLIKGCQSKAWLVCIQDSPQLMWHGTSESKLVQGLLALALCRWQGTPREGLPTLSEAEQFFVDLKLGRHLSASRMGGLRALLQQMFCKPKD
jgi:sulfur transfer protein SufE